MSPSLLEPARDGDAGAIAALLTHALQPQGITVRGKRESYCLYLWFTSSPAPPQTATVAYARRTMEKLQASGIGIVQLYGEQTGSAQPRWREEIALLSLSSGSSIGDESQASDWAIPDLSILTAGENNPVAPVLQPSAVSDRPTPIAVARAYEELGLPLGASLAEVESVYFNRRAALLKRGDRATLEPLKWAFTTLKTHLEQPIAEVDSSRYPPLSQGATAVNAPPRARSLQPQPHAQPGPDDTDILSFQNRYSNGLIFPVLLLLGMLMNAMPIANALLFGIKIWFHEFGHATVAWLAGRQALPLPVGWTSYNPQRSLFVYLGMLTLLGLLFWAARREGQRWPMGLAAGLAVVQFTMTWLLPLETFNLLFSFGGIGGEIYLSALLMVGFYFPLPHYFRWDFYRFPVVVGAAFCFWGQLWLWGQIRRGKASIPFGALWGEADHGDMNQLANVHGWTPGEIIGTYSAIAHLCLFAIVAVYGYTLFRQHRDFFAALGRQWLP